MSLRLRLSCAALVLMGASVIGAQPAALARGTAWFGCWESADPVPVLGVTCVVPEDPAGLRIIALTSTGTRTETVVRLDGARVALAAEGCEGWQRGRMTPDGERILLDGETRCTNLPRQVSAGAFVIAPTGEWVSVQGGGLSAVALTQVRRYRPLTNPSDVPVALRAVVGPYLAEGDMARAGLADATLSAADLLEMERMGVPDPMLDAVVAASYPSSFVIAGGPVRPSVEASPAEPADAVRRPMYLGGTPTLSYFDWAMWGNCGSAWGLMDPLGCGWFPGYRPIGGAYYPPSYRYGAYGVYGPYGYPYGGGIIIQPIDPWRPGPGGNAGGGATGGGSTTGGRMVRGRGYVQDGAGSGGGTAQPRNPSGGGGSVRAEGGSSGGSGTAGSSSSGGSSAPRTAKRRDP
ncbi:MAG: hypothetical protein RL139_50 [Gemmatimonadota bacterium]|jgi:hypothetical protein